MASSAQLISIAIPNDGNKKTGKLAFTNPFYTPNTASTGIDAFRRDDELRHSTGSMRGRLQHDPRMEHKVKQLLAVSVDDQYVGTFRSRCSSDGSDIAVIKRVGRDMQKNHSAQELIVTDGSASDIQPSVSSLIKGFQSKIDGQVITTPRLVPGFLRSGSSHKDLSKSAGASPTGSPTPPEKHRRGGTKRKLSIRRRAKTTVDQANINIIEKLGLLPFFAGENGHTKKSFAHFDVQSIFFDIANAVVLKNLYEEGSNRQKNISTGASAASIRGQKKRLQAGEGDAALERFRSRTDSVIDDGDTKVNELVSNCPYFRNEIGDLEEVSKFPGNRFNKNYEDDFAKVVSGFGKNRTPSFEILHTETSDMDRAFQQVSKLTDLDGMGQVTLLEPVEEESAFYLWDDPRKEGEKRIFDFEHLDYGALYYRDYFYGKDHMNYFGMDEKYGPIAISVKREPLDKMAVLGYVTNENSKSSPQKFLYRIVLRTTELQTLRGVVVEDNVPSTSRHGTSRGLPHKDIFEFCFPELQLSCLRQATQGPKVPEQLMKLDEQQLTLQYKVGVMYCKEGQSSEEEMYNNEEASPAFQEFLETVGEKVLLKGFEGYRAQLDNKNDSTGTHSLYAKFHNREVMFHVSTMLPWTGNNKQQLLRKRHIGNDIVTVIFQEPGAVPFSPKNVRSHFQHVFIIVQVENPNTENTSYRVAVTRSMDVPYFGPPIPPNARFGRNKAFKDFLLTKIINAENAAHKSEKFTAMAIRTRFEYLKDLATNFVSANSLDSGAKFSMFSMSLSGKKKEKTHPNVSPELWCQGALVWAVRVDLESGSSGYVCHMGISTKTLAFADKTTKEVLFAVPCKAVIGWRPSPTSIKLFYNNGQSITFALAGDDEHELPFVINRLKAVTPGCETQDLTLRRNSVGQLGFHVFYEGLVAEVEPYGMAWQSGLRKGSRLLEIGGISVAGMPHDHMIQLLKKPGAVRVVILPPTPDGQPRHYKALRNLRRCSSMTSLYSINAHNSPESGSMMSSKENLTHDSEAATPPVGDLINNHRNGSLKHAVPPRRDSYLASRNGIAPGSDHSLDTGEISSQDRLASLSSSTDINLSSDYIRRSLNDVEYRRRSSENAGHVVRKSVKAVLSTTSTHSVDDELNEIERSLASTRKSIDAKFYRSLANSQVPAGRKIDRSVKSGDGHPVADHVTRSVEDLARMRDPAIESGEREDRLSHGRSSTSPRRRTSSQRYVKDEENSERSCPNSSVLNEQHDTYGSRIRRQGSRSGSTQGKQSHQRSSDSTNHISGSPRDVEMALRAAPPRYENVVKNYPPPPPRANGQVPTRADAPHYHNDPRGYPRSEERISRKESNELGSRQTSDSFDRYSSLDSRNSDLPSRPPRRRHSSKESKQRSASDTSEQNSLKGDAVSKKGSDDRLEKSPSNETPRRGSGLMQTRIRDVTDLITEQQKSSKRKDSPDVVLSLQDSAMTPTTRDAFNKEGYYIVTSTTEVPEYAAQYGKANPEGAPVVRSGSQQPISPPSYASHLEAHASRGIEQSATHGGSQDRLPYKETTLGPVITTVETYEENNQEFRVPPGGDLRPLREALGKLDQMLPSKEQSSVQPKEERRRKKRTTKRRSKQNVERNYSESSDEDYSENRRTNSPSLRRLINAGNRTSNQSNDKSRPSSSDSNVRNKSEAEESLEAAITEFNESLSTLPKNQGDRLNLRRPGPTQSSSDKSSGSSATPDRVTSPVDNSREGTIDRPYEAGSYGSMPRSAYRGIHGRFLSEDMCKTSSTREYADSVRKASIDSMMNKGRMEAKISLISSPRPWLPRDPSGRPLRRLEDNVVGSKSENVNVRQRFSSHGNSAHGRGSLTGETLSSDSLRSGRGEPEDSSSLSNVREDVRDIVTPLPNIPLSPGAGSVFESIGMLSLPGRGGKNKKSTGRPSVIGMPLTVRGLDLAASKESRVPSSSKQDLEVMLNVLVEQLEEEREEKYRLAEELAKTKEEKERLLEQSQAAASQLRKFTSWFFDSVSKKDEDSFL